MSRSACSWMAKSFVSRASASVADPSRWLGKVAAELEDLKKTQLVSEAVLTTAIAQGICE